jgi:hypothetical protein
VKETLSVAPAVTAQEAVLPGRVQEALSELVGAAKEGLLALSVATGLGVLADGIKVPLGLWDGSTENKTVAAHLLSDLVHRGLDVEQGVQAIGCASCRDTSPTSKAKGSRPPDEPGVSGRSSTLWQSATPPYRKPQVGLQVSGCARSQALAFDAGQPRGGRDPAHRAARRRRSGVAFVRQGLRRCPGRHSTRRPGLTSDPSPRSALADQQRTATSFARQPRLEATATGVASSVRPGPSLVEHQRRSRCHACPGSRPGSRGKCGAGVASALT